MIRVKKIKSCPEKYSWAHECSLKIAKWPTKMGTPSLRYNMSLILCKDNMRISRSLWRHSNQNQIIEIDILIFFEGVPPRECFVFPLFLKTFPHLLVYLLFLRPQKENRTSLLSLHFDVVGTGDLFFYAWPLVTRIFFSKILGTKSSGSFYCDRLCDRLLSLLMGGSN